MTTYSERVREREREIPPRVSCCVLSHDNNQHPPNVSCGSQLKQTGSLVDCCRSITIVFVRRWKEGRAAKERERERESFQASNDNNDDDDDEVETNVRSVSCRRRGDVRVVGRRREWYEKRVVTAKRRDGVLERPWI